MLQVGAASSHLLKEGRGARVPSSWPPPWGGIPAPPAKGGRGGEGPPRLGFSRKGERGREGGCAVRKSGCPQGFGGVPDEFGRPACIALSSWAPPLLFPFAISWGMLRAERAEGSLWGVPRPCRGQQGSALGGGPGVEAWVALGRVGPPCGPSHWGQARWSAERRLSASTRGLVTAGLGQPDHWRTRPPRPRASG